MMAPGRDFLCRRGLPDSIRALARAEDKSAVLQIALRLSRFDFHLVRLLGERYIMFATHS